jgi:hypothetical protein
MMNRTKLNKLRAQLDKMRREQLKAADLERLANKLGRKKVVRGKEPTWESEFFRELRPLTIPHHGAKDLSIGVKRSVLNALEDDLLAWEAKLDDEEEERGK